MAKAGYKIVQVDHQAEMVFLIDRNDGDMTVTNDAEAVCDEVNNAHRDKRIIYRDTEGNWSELDHQGGVFNGFKPWGGTPPSL